MSKFRNKQLRNILESVNKDLAHRGVKSVTDPLFTFWRNWLLDNGYYNGFNFYKWRTVYVDGESLSFLALAGTTNSDEFDCLQIW